MSTRVSRAEPAKTASVSWWQDQGVAALRRFAALAAKPIVLTMAVLWLSMLWNLPVDLRDFDAQAVSTNWPALLLPALSAVVLNASFVDGIAFEILALTLLIALIPPLRAGRIGAVVRHGVAAVTLLVVILCLTDLGVRMVLGRPFAPLLDLGIYANVVDLQKGSFKGITGWFLTLAQLILAVLIYGGAFKAVQVIQRVTSGRHYGPLILVMMAGLTLSYIGAKWLPESRVAQAHDRLIHARASTTLWKQSDRSWRMLAALHRFEKAVEVDQFPELPPERLLAKLGDVDVALVFFES